MKIILDLPDWCDERHIYILAGVELAAYKEAQEDRFHVKTSRCAQCGGCCRDLLKSHYYPVNDDGSCSKMEKDGVKFICSLGALKPLPCAEGDPVKNSGDKSFCSIRYDGDT